MWQSHSRSTTGRTLPGLAVDSKHGHRIRFHRMSPPGRSKYFTRNVATRCWSLMLDKSSLYSTHCVWSSCFLCNGTFLRLNPLLKTENWILHTFKCSWIYMKDRATPGIIPKTPQKGSFGIFHLRCIHCVGWCCLRWTLCLHRTIWERLLSHGKSYTQRDC